MTLRMHWYETEEWVRAECDMYLLGKPMLLPKAEFGKFRDRFMKRLGTMLRVSTTPIVNHPHAKLLWWTWLNLDPEQQEHMRESDKDDVIGQCDRVFANHPEVVKQMQNRRHLHEYWNGYDFIALVYDITRKCIVSLDRKVYLALNYEYYCNPLVARYRNNAIQFDGSNLDDIMLYVGDRYPLISETTDRLILGHPKGNYQILKGQWVWFKDGVLKHGNSRVVTMERLNTPDRRDWIGFWNKPTAKDRDPIFDKNLCPEVVA